MERRIEAREVVGRRELQKFQSATSSRGLCGARNHNIPEKQPLLQQQQEINPDSLLCVSLHDSDPVCHWPPFWNSTPLKWRSRELVVDAC